MHGRWARVVRTPLGLTAAALVVAVLALACFGPLLWGDGADAVDTDGLLAQPAADHWAGTDNLGRDILLRVLVASRLSIALALLAIVISVVAGLVLGSAPFVLGRRSGRLVAAAVSIAVAFPKQQQTQNNTNKNKTNTTGAVLASGLAGAPACARLTQT